MQTVTFKPAEKSQFKKYIKAKHSLWFLKYDAYLKINHPQIHAEIAWIDIELSVSRTGANARKDLGLKPVEGSLENKWPWSQYASKKSRKSTSPPSRKASTRSKK